MKDKILLQWLNIDLNYIGIKLNMFSENTAKVDDDLIKETIRVLDYETTVEKNPSINYVITIIALMWEYVDKTKFYQWDTDAQAYYAMSENAMAWEVIA